MSQMMEVFTTWLGATWWTLAEMAPYLLLGFAVAGVLSVWLSPMWVERHLGGKGLWPVIKAAALGVPLPLCSCGVIPVAASLRQHGAGRGATTSFLLSTPQTGVDSILATYALLGPVFALLRPMLALISGIVGGAIVSITDRDTPATTAPKDQPSITQSTNKTIPLAVTGSMPVDAVTKSETPTSKADCCQGNTCHSAQIQSAGLTAKVRQALQYGFITLPNDIAKPLIFGILLAGIITAVASPDALEPWLGGGFSAMLLMLIIGTPLYVCSTGSIPLALSFMHLGASPGAVLVFLISGPATNAATISVIWKVLGPRTATIYLLTVITTALSSGLLLDAMVLNMGASGGGAIGSHEHVASMTTSASGHIWAGLMVLCLIVSMSWTRLGNRNKPINNQGESAMNPPSSTTVTLSVQGMTCSHCAAAVTRALREVSGVKDVQVTLADGKAVVSGDAPAHALPDSAQLITKVESLGYKAQVLQA